MDIDAPELLEMLRKVEKRGVIETARRLRQLCGQVFRYAIVTGRAKHDPSADLRGALKSARRPRGHKAMPLDEMATFMLALGAYDGDLRTRLALPRPGVGPAWGTGRPGPGWPGLRSFRYRYR